MYIHIKQTFNGGVFRTYYIYLDFKLKDYRSYLYKFRICFLFSSIHSDVRADMNAIKNALNKKV